MSTALVTGGSSSLGVFVIPKLLERFERVIATSRSDSSSRLIRALGAESLDFDLENPVAVGVHAQFLVHIAGVRYHEGALHLMRGSGADHLIAVSSASSVVEGHPNRGWLLTAEKALMAAAPHSTIVRPTMIYGSARDRNLFRLYKLLRRARLAPRVSGGAVLMPVIVDDVAAAIVELVDDGSPTCVRPISGPTQVDFGEILKALCRAGRIRQVPPRLPLQPVIWGARALGSHDRKAIHALQMLGVNRIVEPPHKVGFRYAPTSLDDGLERAVDRYDLALADHASS